MCRRWWVLWRNKSREGIQSTELVVQGRLSLEGRSEGEEMNQKESKTKGRFWGALFTPEVCCVLPHGVREVLEEFEQESDLMWFTF